MKTKEDAAVIALMGRHFAALNELDPGNRKSLAAEVYDPHVKLIDPYGIADGRAQLEKWYDGIHKQMPGFVFRVVDEIDVHHGAARIHWEAAKPGATEKQAGDDIVKVKEGKIVEIIVFFNRQGREAPGKQ